MAVWCCLGPGGRSVEKVDLQNKSRLRGGKRTTFSFSKLKTPFLVGKREEEKKGQWSDLWWGCGRRGGIRLLKKKGKGKIES